MFKKNKLSFLLMMTLMLSLFLAACADGSSDEAESDSTKTDTDSAEESSSNDLIIATISDVANMDPHLTTDVPSVNVQSNMFETLIAYDDQGELIPELATEWNAVNDTTWEITLREGVQFHDGEEFNAEVAKKNFDRIIDPELAAPRAFLFDSVKEFNVKDEYTLEIITDFPFAPILAHLTHPVGVMISPAVIDEDYAAMEEGKEAGTVITENPVGTGYFKFDNWNPGSDITLAKYDGYWGDKVKVDTVTFKAIPEGGTRLAELETGHAHIIEPVQPSEVPQIDGSDFATLDENISTTLSYVGFNLEKEPFNNKQVRQALSMLINQEDILEGIYEGFGIPAVGPLAPGVFGHNPDMKPLSYDPEAAKELLAEAGYADGFETTIWTNDNQQRMDMAILIQEELKQANIDVSIEVVEWGAYLDKTANGEHDMFILGLSNPVGDADYFLTQLFDSANKGVAGNRSFYDNPEVDELLKKGREEIDSEKRQEYYDQIQEILIDDAPMFYVHHQADLSGVSNDIEGYWIDDSGYYMLQDVQFVK